MDRRPLLRISGYTDVVPDDFDCRELRNGDTVLVQMRIIDRNGNEGGFLCVADSFNRDIIKEPEQLMLIFAVDIAGRE